MSAQMRVQRWLLANCVWVDGALCFGNDQEGLLCFFKSFEDFHQRPPASSRNSVRSYCTVGPAPRARTGQLVAEPALVWALGFLSCPVDLPAAIEKVRPERLLDGVLVEVFSDSEPDVAPAPAASVLVPFVPASTYLDAAKQKYENHSALHLVHVLARKEEARPACQVLKHV